MTQELKVSFYLKREGKSKKAVSRPDAIYPIVGKSLSGTVSPNSDQNYLSPNISGMLNQDEQQAKAVLPLNSIERLIKLIS